MVIPGSCRALLAAVIAVLAQNPALALSTPAVTLTATPNPATYGAPVTLTATLPDGASGKVTFYDGMTVLGGGTISAGQALLTTIALPAGIRSIRAYYHGDGTYASGTSSVLPVTVTANQSLLLRRPLVDPVYPEGVLMATGDFNGDGHLDVILGATYSSFTVFLGDGNASFHAGATYTLAFWPGGMTVADFNGDGRPDLAVSIPHNNTVEVFLSNGDGTFQTPAILPVGWNPLGLAAADFNGDGNADLVVANELDNSITFLAGNGDGTFGYGVPFSVSPRPIAVAIGDFNGDGRPDVALTNNNGIQIVIVTGIGSFAAGFSSSAVGADANHILAGDFNGDGITDLIVDDGGIEVVLGTGAGTFAAPNHLNFKGSFQLSALGDLDGDGLTDLAVFDSVASAVAVLKGKGDGTFQDPVNYTGVSGTASLAVGDFDGDGRTDVVVSGYIGVGIQVYRGALVADAPRSDPTISVSHVGGLTQGQTGAIYTITVTNAGLDTTAGIITAKITLPAGLTPTGLTGSGWTCGNLSCSRSDALSGQTPYPDLTLVFTVAANLSGNVTSTFTVAGGSDDNPDNNSVSDTVFVRYPTVTSLTVSPNPARLGSAVTLTSTVTPGATGNVTFYDGSSVLGSAPLVGGTAHFTTTQLQPGVRSLRAQYVGDSAYGPSISPVRSETITSSANGLLPPMQVAVNGPTQWIGVSDFNGDGIPDLVAAISGTGGGVVVFPGKGDGTFGAAIQSSATTAPISGGVADFDGDGKLDVAIAGVDGVWVLLGNGDGTFRKSQASPFAFNCLTVADINGDGKPDLVAEGNGLIVFITGNGDGTFQWITYPGASNCGNFAVADMNGDGRPDIVCLEPAAVTVYLAKATGGVQWAYTGAAGGAGFTGSGITIGDFNGDGKLDVAVTGNGIAVLLGNGDGTLKSSIQSSQPEISGWFAMAADFDGDGNLDLAYTEASVYNQVYLAFGKGDGTFSPVVTLNLPGSSNWLAQADFNLDGRLDLAVSNSGSNIINVPEGPTISVFAGTQYSGLTIVGSHRDRFTAGQTGKYVVTISNNEFATVTGTVSFSDVLPPGLTASAISGDGWNCSVTAVTCTRSDVALASGSSDPPITISVNISGNLTPSVVNNLVRVSNSGHLIESGDRTAIILPTTTSLSVTPSSANLAQLVTMTATVTPGATGMVVFYDGTSYLGSAALNGTQAILATRLPATGQRFLSATYTGDGAYASSFSAHQPESVRAAPSSGLKAQTKFATDTGPLALAIADFNGDGKSDLVTVNETAGTVSVLLGNGDGSFRPRADFPACSFPFAIVAADFNNDGILDVAVSSQNTAYVCILIGNGDGTFQQPLRYWVVRGASPILAADYWHDGKIALLAVATQEGNLKTVSVGSDGSLSGTVIYGRQFTGISQLFMGDFNNDLIPDLLATENLSSIYLYPGNGDGAFQPYVYPVTPFANPLTLGDLNADGNLDLIAAGNNGVATILGNGDSTFRMSVQQDLTSWSYGLTSADVDGDGKLDVVVASSDNTVGVLLGNGDGTLKAPVRYPVGSAPSAVVSGDFNGDGATDLAVVNSQDDSVSILLGAKLPVLAVASSHTDPFGLGETGATYSISVENNGPGSTNGTVTVTDTLPTGIAATSMTGSGWTCTLTPLKCTRGDSLAAGGSYPAITLAVTVGASALSSGTNTVAVSGGGAVGANATDPTTMTGTPITVQTNPAGLQFRIDGKGAMNAPATLYLLAGPHTLGVTATQAGAAGTQYVFTGWNDFGDATRSIDVTGTAAAFTASFKTQYLLTTMALPQPGGTVSPTAGVFYDAGSSVMVTATPNSPYSFGSWSGAASGGVNPASITMNDAQSITANFGVPGFTCAITGDAATSLIDVQSLVNESLGVAWPGHDLNRDGAVNLVDVQKAIQAAMGTGCIY